MYQIVPLKCTECEWVVYFDQSGYRKTLEVHISTEHPERAARNERIRQQENKVLNAFDRILEHYSSK